MRSMNIHAPHGYQMQMNIATAKTLQCLLDICNGLMHAINTCSGCLVLICTGLRLVGPAYRHRSARDSWRALSDVSAYASSTPLVRPSWTVLHVDAHLQATLLNYAHALSHAQSRPLRSEGAKQGGARERILRDEACILI